MKLPGRLAAAIEVLADVETRHRPVSLALKDWGTSHRFAGSGDRAAIGNLVYDALRRKASHAAAMQSDAPRALVLSVAVRDWGEDADELAASFSADKHAPEAITPNELDWLKARAPLAIASVSARADIPDWLAPSFMRAFGDNWAEEAEALTARPPLDLRVNTLKADRNKVLKALGRFDPQSTAIAPFGIRMPAGARDARTPNIQSDEAYLKGWCEVQDEGSQVVSALTGAAPGQQILDFCAGAGGKTLAIAAAMQNKGQIFAYDADRSRLAPIYDRLKRNGARNVQVRAPQPGALDDLRNKMNCVIVDAPCTGTGTWRRRPDTKWKLMPEQLALRTAEQDAVLGEAADYAKPGGRLIYITCSLLPEENEDRIAAFLKVRPDFTNLAPETVWDGVFPDAALKPYFGATGLVLSPRATNTDGFFISVIQRAE